MAKCTNVTFLMRKAAGEASFSKLIDVTNYPDMGGDPEKIDVTTLSHTRRHNIDGIEDVGDGLDFDAFYEMADYERLLAIQTAATLDTYQLGFGNGGADGIWEWEGRLKVYVTGGGVNEARGLKISITDEGEEELHYVPQ